jgi:hypothetical protein
VVEPASEGPSFLRGPAGGTDRRQAVADLLRVAPPEHRIDHVANPRTAVAGEERDADVRRVGQHLDRGHLLVLGAGVEEFAVSHVAPAPHRLFEPRL